MQVIKRIAFYSLILLLSFQACSEGGENAKDKSKPGEEAISAIKFEYSSYDFGDIAYDSDGKCYFPFKNTSAIPLVINRVMTSCGCTSPEWPKKPVQPKEKESLSVTYNTKITGNFRKVITVYSNAEGSPHKLIIEGNVTSKPK